MSTSVTSSSSSSSALSLASASGSGSSSSTSCPPSSSAVTIPVPGKSILKRPPQSQPSLFSRITRFLPTQQSQGGTSNTGSAGASGNADDDAKPLKRAHFILPSIAIVYPISSVNPPSTPTLKEEKRAIEDKEAERRKKVVRGTTSSANGSSSPSSGGGTPADEWWSMDRVESFYRECCAGCEEEADPAITVAFKHASTTNPRTVDFSGVQLNFTSASILSDVFSIEWGLRKLVFRECDLDDMILKPMLHALLIPSTLSFLSLASNRRLKTAAFRLIGAYVKKAKSLQFLDLSQNALDKKSIEYIVAALETAPEPGLVSLRLDDCSLRPAALESLCRAVRTSSLRNISLRHNKISASGGVALALMIRDYPDIVPVPLSPAPSLSSPSNTPTSSAASSPTTSISNMSLVGSPPGTPTMPNSPLVPMGTRAGPPLPPPRHPSIGLQTTYTPYIPKARRGRPGGLATTATNPLSPVGQHVPIITSSSQGGVTTRHPVLPASGEGPRHHGNGVGDGTRHDMGPSAALLDKVRALDSLPRLGALRTLDLKGNDLRNGITYIAQVLKRNRTLKVLNLSENKLDVQCLIIIAEALKYNSCLETLDLNKNPCSGPGLEGIQSLRTAFTLNTALKRLFLSSTSMTSAGAIALAEFLPGSTSLLHLDLTTNDIDIAGVMALSGGLKANHVMRCLDLNIPPGDEEFARMCREILNSCVRNTEEAERASKGPESHKGPANGIPSIGGASNVSGRGQGKGLWGMIEDSELAKSIRLDEEKKIENDILVRARSWAGQLNNVLIPGSPLTPRASNDQLPTRGRAPSKSPSPQPLHKPPTMHELKTKANALISELSIVIQETEDPMRLEELLEANDELITLLNKLPSTTTTNTSGRPQLTLKGLGVGLDERSQLAAGDGDGMLDGFPNLSSGKRPINGALTNGEGEDIDETFPPSSSASDQDGDEDDDALTPTTPKIDKGKGRAPDPEPETILSPKTFRMLDADGEEANDQTLSGSSPTDRSRSWVEEEGEVFRKGNVLLGPAEMEGEYAGEDLRKELLEAMVERPPPRPLADDYGMDIITGIGGDPAAFSADLGALGTPLPPLSPSNLPTNGHNTPDSPKHSPKPAPRPYISRSRSSSSSILSLISPTLPSASTEFLDGEVNARSGGGSPRTPQGIARSNSGANP